MSKHKHRKKKQGASGLSPAEEQAVRKFAAALEELLAGLRRAGERIQELLGRWEQSAEGAPGLLGGNLLTLVNEVVLAGQLEHLSKNVAHARREPADLVDHADFFGGLLGEYAALLKVLAGIELEPDSPLAEEWENIADELLQHGADLQQRADELETELEGEGEGEAEESSAELAGMRTASRAFFREIWEKSQAGLPLSAEAARLAQAMREHPEYREAWESADETGEDDYTINGVNPFVHLTMHVAVETQIAQGDPPETAATLNRLVAAGLPRHEAVHRIANLIGEQMWHMLRERRPFDRAAYLRGLREL